MNSDSKNGIHCILYRDIYGTIFLSSNFVYFLLIVFLGSMMKGSTTHSFSSFSEIRILPLFSIESKQGFYFSSPNEMIFFLDFWVLF